MTTYDIQYAALLKFILFGSDVTSDAAMRQSEYNWWLVYGGVLWTYRCSFASITCF